MSTLWQQAAAGAWRPVAPDAAPADEARLLTVGDGPDRAAVLLVRPGAAVRVNGQPVLGGLRLLAHRDEILIGRLRCFYSAESTPLPAPYRHEGGGRRPLCPVCRGPVQDGERAVRCPGCGRWHHQLDAARDGRAKPCYTYAPACRFCAHPTDLSGGPVWRPEQEDAHV
jgi:hypothetical protein